MDFDFLSKQLSVAEFVSCYRVTFLRVFEISRLKLRIQGLINKKYRETFQNDFFLKGQKNLNEIVERLKLMNDNS